jgi:hypothetical protein
MMLHGEPVAVGDAVYDILRGAGFIERLRPDGKFEVRFTTTRMLRVFQQDGRPSPGDPILLYWHDPVVFIPLKREAAYVQQRNLSSAIRDALSRACTEIRA